MAAILPTLSRRTSRAVVIGLVLTWSALVADRSRGDAWLPPRVAPHPAVAQIIVEEGGARSFGSGTLVGNHGEYGLVVTNWHVVRDRQGEINVLFPNGFRSPARVLRTDRDWDLAALMIWRPAIAPVPLAARAPEPGEWLAIAGYGSGSYRAARGVCRQYVAPGLRFPMEMIEVGVEARQGDSGGPIFNREGQLAGVLFGASHGSTTGSYSGRVARFLAPLWPAPLIENQVQPPSAAIARHDPPDPHAQPALSDWRSLPGYPESPVQGSPTPEMESRIEDHASRDSGENSGSFARPGGPPPAPLPPRDTAAQAEVRPDGADRLAWKHWVGDSMIEQAKAVLAVVGVLALMKLLLFRSGS